MGNARGVRLGDRQTGTGWRRSRARRRESFERLDAFVPSWMQVVPSDEIREVARRLLRVHPLRAADALQLAAAGVASERRPSTIGFVTFDDRLRDAASREGFLIADVNDH